MAKRAQDTLKYFLRSEEPVELGRFGRQWGGGETYLPTPSVHRVIPSSRRPLFRSFLDVLVSHYSQVLSFGEQTTMFSVTDKFPTHRVFHNDRIDSGAHIQNWVSPRTDESRLDPDCVRKKKASLYFLFTLGQKRRTFVCV